MGYEVTLWMGLFLSIYLAWHMNWMVWALYELVIIPNSAHVVNSHPITSMILTPCCPQLSFTIQHNPISLSPSLPPSLGFTIVASMHYNCQWPLVLHVDDKAIRRVVIQQWWNEMKWSTSSRSTRYTVMISLHGFILNRKQAQKRLSNWFCFPAGSLPKAERGEKIIKTASVDLSSQNCRSN